MSADADLIAPVATIEFYGGGTADLYAPAATVMSNIQGSDIFAPVAFVVSGTQGSDIVAPAATVMSNIQGSDIFAPVAFVVSGTQGSDIVAPAVTLEFYGGGTADLIPPAVTLEFYGGGVAELTSPAAIITAGVTITGNAALTGRRATLRAFGGGNSSIVAPRATIASAGGSSAILTILPPTLYAIGHDSTGEWSFTYTAPSALMSAFGGGTAKLRAPRATLSTTATSTIFGAARLTAPVSSLLAAGTTTQVARTSLTAPSPNLIGYGGAVCSVRPTGRPAISSRGTTGGIGGAAVTLPLFALTASGTAQNFGSADLIAPAAQLGAQAQAYLVAPGTTLTAVGTAVVTATYEAYALNLSHQPRRGNEQPVDEMTHYTNFPFTHVVRYQNSYFGANSTGLYLLEGTTDAGTDIPWAVKTGYTDFDSPQLKTVHMAYFGGRLGPDSTITLYPGEATTTPHAHNTPRGTAVQNYRQAFGRGQKSRYHALGASGDDAMAIDSITLNVATLARKV